MEERRRYGRKEPNVNVVCWTADAPMKRVTAETVNVSFGGIGLRLNNEVGLNRIVRLRIQKGLWQRPIEALGRIVWQGRPDISGRTMAGIKFISVPWTRIEEVLCR